MILFSFYDILREYYYGPIESHPIVGKLKRYPRSESDIPYAEVKGKLSKDDVPNEKLNMDQVIVDNNIYFLYTKLSHQT